MLKYFYSNLHEIFLKIYFVRVSLYLYLLTIFLTLLHTIFLKTSILHSIASIDGYKEKNIGTLGHTASTGSVTN